MQNNENFIKNLACPQCKGRLYPEDKKNGLACKECLLLYPIREGIPIMLKEQALTIEVYRR